MNRARSQEPGTKTIEIMTWDVGRGTWDVKGRENGT